MKILSALKSTFKLAAVSATILTNCGSGGGGSSSNDSEVPTTVRPKTLSGLTLDIGPGLVSLDFVRSITSRYANKAGQTEFGAVVYNPGARTEKYQSVTFQVDVVWPTFLNNDLSYTYTAINDTSGIISLTGGDGAWTVQDLTATDPSSYYNIVYFSEGTETYNINITFGTDGNSITSTLSRIAPEDLLNAGIWSDPRPDVMRINDLVTISDVTVDDPSVLSFTDSGAPVPVNYSTETDDADRVSTISNTTLDNRTVSLLSDSIDPTDYFPEVLETGSYTFTKDPNGAGTLEYDEAGTGNYEQPLIEAGGDTTTQKQISDSGSYTYQRIVNTDKAKVRFNGNKIGTETLTLKFVGKEGPNQRASGTYTISGGIFDGDKGVFRIINEL